MRLITAFTALSALLMGLVSEAVAATQWVPRIEQVARCNWDRPGHNPFMGDVVAAIDRYIEIPTPVRIRLKQRMQARQYDDLVDIRRDEIKGREHYEPVIRDMHFGLDRVCREVTRERWTPQMQERGLVYCEQGHCILVPTVCRNVSRIERRPALVAGATKGGASDGELVFAPPSTGMPTARTDSATADASGPSTTVLPYAETVAGTGTALGPTDRNASMGGNGGDRLADGPSGVADTRGRSLPAWPGGWGLGPSANSGSVGGFVGDLLQSGAPIVPCLASSGSQGRGRVASGWRYATGGGPVRLAARRRNRLGALPGFRQCPRRHRWQCSVARRTRARNRHLTPRRAATGQRPERWRSWRGTTSQAGGGCDTYRSHGVAQHTDNAR